MRILILCREFPLPLTSGEKIRCYHILKGLANHHEVTLVSLVHRSSELHHVEELKQFCQNIYTFEFKLSKRLSVFKMLFSLKPWDVIAFYDKEMKLKVRELINSQKFDVVWVNFLSLANYLEPDMASKSIFILDQHNVDELWWENYARESNNIVVKLLAMLNLQKVKYLQQKVLNYFNAIVCVSKEDANYMEERVPTHARIWVIPNGVDTDYFIPTGLSNNKAKIIMLCASMDVTMNIDAALQFARKAFPIIKDKIPDSEFLIVGRNPVKEILMLDKEGYIKVTGSVDDLRPYYAKAKVVVAPYRFGGGTKLKILEALAMNLPIVSTSIGCQGIDSTGITQLIIRDNMKEFAYAVVEVLESDITKRNWYGDNARRLVEERYSWRRITEALEPNLLKLMK